MRILLLGANGQLGRCLTDELAKTEHTVIAATRMDADFENPGELSAFVQRHSPRAIINSSAYTAVDAAESALKTADRVNHLAVKELADVAELVEATLVQVSTDYVFDGKTNTPYCELDAPNPRCNYGRTKLNGELAIRNSQCNHLIVRTSWLFSEYGKNFLKTMINLWAGNKDSRVVQDQTGTPTYARHLAQALAVATEQVVNNRNLVGTYHYSGNLPCSWFSFAECIFASAKKLGISGGARLQGITTQEYPTPAQRPPYSALSSERFAQTFSVGASNWELGIASALSNLRASEKNFFE